LQQKLKPLYTTAIAESETEFEKIRKALEKINEIRGLKNERRMVAKNSGNKETIRRGALMKALQTEAQTMPLFISISKKGSQKPPPLCGRISPEPNHISKAGVF
jgi:SAGA-associated factor 29